MYDDLEEINERMREFIKSLQNLPGKMLEQAQQDMLWQIGGLDAFQGKEQGVDPYRILGLDKTASDEEVKQRYRERLRQFHPDTGGEGLEFHLQMVMTAYEMIRRERGLE